MTQVTRLTLDKDGTLGRQNIHLGDPTGELGAPLVTVGQDLRAARLARGDDLATVSRVLKIRKEHLDALEDDRAEALPGKTYAVGFIRAYAAYLGLDPAAFAERFKAEIAGRNDINPPKVTVIDEDEHRKLPQGWWAIAVVVLLLVFYGAYQLLSVADRAMREQVSEPPPLESNAPPPVYKPIQPKPAEAAQAAAPDGQNPGSNPGSNPGANPEANSTTSPADQAGVAPNSAAATKPGPNATSVVPPAAGTKPAPVAGVKPAAANGPASPVLPQGKVYGERNLNARVVLRAVQPMRILVQGPDDRLFIGRTLQPGDVYQVPNLPGLKLTVDDGSAVEVRLDGQLIGRAGKAGSPVEAAPLDPNVLGRYRH
ncbi:MAG: RodZ domain-containing protein [Rhizomicrobium sp.]